MKVSNKMILLLSESASVDKINETSMLYQKIAYALLILAAIFLIISIFVWFKLNIRHEIIVLTGFGVKKEVARIEKKARRETEEAAAGAGYYRPGARMLSNAGLMDANITENIGEMQTMPIRHTTLIKDRYETNMMNGASSEETLPLDSISSVEETMMLSKGTAGPYDNNGAFVVEKDEVYVSNQDNNTLRE